MPCRNGADPLAGSMLQAPHAIKIWTQTYYAPRKDRWRGSCSAIRGASERAEPATGRARQGAAGSSGRQTLVRQARYDNEGRWHCEAKAAAQGLATQQPHRPQGTHNRLAPLQAQALTQQCSNDLRSDGSDGSMALLIVTRMFGAHTLSPNQGD